jgi:hypothetical protein
MEKRDTMVKLLGNGEFEITQKIHLTDTETTNQHFNCGKDVDHVHNIIAYQIKQGAFVVIEDMTRRAQYGVNGEGIDNDSYYIYDDVDNQWTTFIDFIHDLFPPVAPKEFRFVKKYRVFQISGHHVHSDTTGDSVYADLLDSWDSTFDTEEEAFDFMGIEMDIPMYTEEKSDVVLVVLPVMIQEEK